VPADSIDIDQNLQRHCAVSLRQHGFLVTLLLFLGFRSFIFSQVYKIFVMSHTAKRVRLIV